MQERILVVEDNPQNMLLVTDLLSLHGYDVIKATNGAYALVLAETDHPDLILMDIALKGMNGLEITHLLKDNPNTASIPVIALTAYAGDLDRQKAMDAGCTAFIPKPIDTREFPKLIDKYLREARRQ